MLEGKTLPCIVCGYAPNPVDPDGDVVNQPHGATVFDSHGHYGSTVHDPMMDPHYLEINVCDRCLRDRKDRVLYRIDIQRTESEYRVWEVPDEQAV